MNGFFGSSFRFSVKSVVGCQLQETSLPRTIPSDNQEPITILRFGEVGLGFHVPLRRSACAVIASCVKVPSSSARSARSVIAFSVFSAIAFSAFSAIQTIRQLNGTDQAPTTIVEILFSHSSHVAWVRRTEAPI